MKPLADISVVVPVYNEEKVIPEIYSRLLDSLNKISENNEIIFIDDGSKDQTLELIKGIVQKDKRIRYISFSRNFGHQVAVAAGLHHANGKAVVLIDGDLQDPPELIPEMYAKMKEGFKVVVAKRKSRKDPFLKKIAIKIFYRLLSRITSFDIPLDTGDFRVMDKKVVDQVNEMSEQNKYIRGQIAWLGYKTGVVEFDRDERKYGKSKYSYWKLIKLALNGITGFSNFPLRLASISGFIVSGVSFIIILYALYSKFVMDYVITGWTSIVISTMFIGGIQLLSIGIIGEYISRINVDVRKRPLYVVEETNVEGE